MSQVELAEKAGITRSFISKVENGTKKLNYHRLKLIADALEVTISELIPDNEKINLYLDEWAYLFDDLKQEGLTVDQVREYIDIARKHIKRDEEK